MKTHLYIASLLFISIFSLTSCQDKKENKSPVEEKQDCLTAQQLKNLNPVRVENSPLTQKLRLTGKMAYNPNAVVNYVSLVSGVITHTYVSLGDKIAQGQVMAEIKSAELNEMQTEVKQLQAKLEVAQRELLSTQSFYDDKIASEKELIEAKSKKESLKSELEKLQSNLQIYHPGKTKNTYEIRAPRSGYLVDNKLVSGMQITAEGAPLFTISDMNEVWVNMNVYATNLDFVKENMPIEIKTNAYPDKTFKGEITQISNVMDPDENVLKARVVLKNEALLLKPGLHVEGIVKSEKNKQMPRLPAQAVVYANDKYYVILIKDKCDVVTQEVKIHSQDENTMYIESGLKPGQEIATQKVLLQFEELTGNN